MSLKDKVYNAILDDIISLEYHPGDILNERSLIDRYQCSKSPVREALMTLCSENVLRNIPRYGYEVIRLTEDDISEMIQFRLILESGMLSMYYNSFTAEQIGELEEIDEKCQSDSSDVWTHWAHNVEFHLKLIESCGSKFAMEELERCMNRLKRAYAQFYKNKNDIKLLSTDTKHHSEIIAGLKNKNSTQILKNLTADLNDFGGLENYIV
ncbi:GntR family transcriptional regulator [Marispirochaeta sp.]|uniref:GntR family transcriptional regulator n=1 Tax=Marispirochaeta sp. TaxID=2038653 RepID=UPI0029C60B94|nr:GntR family transcriptional regulator [Marispirochaeta sp.]